MSFSATSAVLKAYEHEIGYKLPQALPYVRSAGRQALYGGRCENFFCGDTRQANFKGELFLFDFKAQYGRIMAEEEFPDFSEAYFSKKPETRFHIAWAEVEVGQKIHYPPLAWHHEPPKHKQVDKRLASYDRGALLFPSGRFTGCWCDVDLSYEQVQVLRYKKVLNFPNASHSFKGFVERFIPHKSSEIAKAIKKNIYTSFSGKFAQSNRRTMLLKNDPDKLRPEDYRTGQFFGDWVLVTRYTPWPRFSNFVWTAYVNAYGRRNLHRLFEAIHAFGGRPLYCNTDGCPAIMPSARAARLVADSFPELPLKIEAKESARVLGPRAYMYRDHEGNVDVAAGGIPKKVHGQIVEGKDEVWAEVPDTFFQAMQRGQIEKELKNTWTLKKFTFSQARKLGRILQADGWTRPIQVGEAC